MIDTEVTASDIRHVAAIDLGSNSFHMLVVRIVHDDIQPLFKYKERVRLAEGLDSQNRLSSEAIHRGVAVLGKFAEQLTPFENCEVRVIATHTIRIARNRNEFLKAASQVLPYNIEVVSGDEEARLVYLGVNATEQLQGNTLVIDIGGGSTEVVIGCEGDIKTGRSHAKGCVTYTDRYFKNGIDKKSYKQAKIAAMQQLERFQSRFIQTGWSQVRATSGTAQALATVSTNLGYSDGVITPKSIKAIRDLLIAGKESNKAFKGVSEQRMMVLIAGVAIMDAVFESLCIEEARFSAGALREGVLSEFDQHDDGLDTRSRSVQSLMLRYLIDNDQAERVAHTAGRFWDQLASSWNLPAFTRRYLKFAALTHEVGLNISASGLHKHSAYVVENSTLPGFTVEQQQLVAAIVRLHRKRLRIETIPALGIASEETILALVLILRLATLWHVNRHPQAPELPILKATKSGYEVELPESYQEDNSLLVADLERESELCAQAGVELTLCFV